MHENRHKVNIRPYGINLYYEIYWDTFLNVYGYISDKFCKY